MPPIDKKSLERHDSIRGGYKSLDVETVRAQNAKCTKDLMQYDDDKPLGRVLDANPDIQICVDIGSGLGWAADLMAQDRREVYAIEPSESAMTIAQQLYGHRKNIG